jgi:hypothetical protein
VLPDLDLLLELLLLLLLLLLFNHLLRNRIRQLPLMELLLPRPIYRRMQLRRRLLLQLLLWL